MRQRKEGILPGKVNMKLCKFFKASYLEKGGEAYPRVFRIIIIIIKRNLFQKISLYTSYVILFKFFLLLPHNLFLSSF